MQPEGQEALHERGVLVEEQLARCHRERRDLGTASLEISFLFLPIISQESDHRVTTGMATFVFLAPIAPQ